jgi:hypothetical protein
LRRKTEKRVIGHSLVCVTGVVNRLTFTIYFQVLNIALIFGVVATSKKRKHVKMPLILTDETK